MDYIKTKGKLGYDSFTGTANGHPECTHGAAAVLALAYRLYHRDPLGLPLPKTRGN